MEGTADSVNPREIACVVVKTVKTRIRNRSSGVRNPLVPVPLSSSVGEARKAGRYGGEKQNDKRRKREPQSDAVLCGRASTTLIDTTL